MNDQQQLPEDGNIELFSFRVRDQEYCLDVMTVREVRCWTPATPLPHAPAHVVGVINLRGTVLPVLDLAVRLGLAPALSDIDSRAVIVVVQQGSSNAGLLVDSVSDIVTLPRAGFQPASDLGDGLSGSCIAALTLHDDAPLRVLDLAAVLGSRNA